jgi:hypothetical protein
MLWQSIRKGKNWSARSFSQVKGININRKKNKIEQWTHHITCGYVACVPDCRGSVCCVSQLSAYNI